MKLDLPYPAKALWPNGRAHHQAKAREAKKHRQWGYNTAMAGGRVAFAPDAFPLRVRITVHAKPKGPLPDRDNVSAAAKSLLDGIADWIGVDDKHFAAPVVEFAEPRNGRFIVEIGGEG